MERHCSKSLQDQFESEVASIQFSLALVMIAMILLEHVIACIWFGLGGSDGDTWLTTHTSVIDKAHGIKEESSRSKLMFLYLKMNSNHKRI